MTVVGLHPEDLFDKLFDGELSLAEHDRLQQHLQACEVCRFEYAARRDFQAEAREQAACPPPALPLRPLLAPESAPPPVPMLAASTRRRPGSRFVVWGLAAAALISASGAVAAGIAGKARWTGLSSMFAAPHVAAPPRVAAPPAPADKHRLAPGSLTTLSAPPAPAPTAVDVSASSAAPHAVRVQGHGRLDRAERSAAPPLPRPVPPAEASPAITVKEPAVVELGSPGKLFAEANQARRAGDIGRASGLYHALQEQYAGSPEAELSRVTLALLLLDTGDAQAALVGFERYLAGASRGLEAEALVGRARALGRLGRRSLEAAAWQEVQRKYPRSIYGRQATERLSALGQP